MYDIDISIHIRLKYEYYMNFLLLMMKDSQLL